LEFCYPLSPHGITPEGQRRKYLGKIFFQNTGISARALVDEGIIQPIENLKQSRIHYGIKRVIKLIQKVKTQIIRFRLARKLGVVFP
jgi:hypothetical protein